MIPQKQFKLSRQAMLLATISAAFPVTGYCVAAGRVDFAIGNVESVAVDGTRHPLNKGAEINSGETISTATGARAQVRFIDGGFISLQPNTLFRVDEFNYKNKADGSEKGFFSLLKGGLRAITGIIGHVNKQTYRVTTPTATLGIRGTGFNMVLRDDGLFVNVGEGAISLTNNAGFLVVTAGGAAFVANINTAPVPTTQPPYLPPQVLPPPAFTVADNRTSSGNLTLLNLSSGPGYAMVYAATGSLELLPLTGVTATFSSAGPLEQYSWTNANGATQTGSIGSATASFFATDGIIGWGRWVGTTAGTLAPHPMTGVFDYVVGIPTAAMPTTGTATYSLMGYTSPTATDGSSGYSVNGTLSANFGASTVVVNMNIANSANSYTINNTAIPSQITITGSTFNGAFVSTTGTTAGVNCLSCSAAVNGLFAGTNASRAGLSYSINTGAGAGPANNIQGVATFAKN